MKTLLKCFTLPAKAIFYFGVVVVAAVAVAIDSDNAHDD
jgi:hypothetical protein